MREVTSNAHYLFLGEHLGEYILVNTFNCKSFKSANHFYVTMLCQKQWLEAFY